MKEPVLRASNLVKTYGKVIALNGSDLELFPGEVLAVVGDNGAGKSTLIKCLSGAEVPDSGEIYLDGVQVHFHKPQDGRAAGIETVYQTLAVAPALDIASNLYLGREMRKTGPRGLLTRLLDNSGMRNASKKHIADLGISTIQNINQAVETLSGGQRQAVAVARALGVRESNQVLKLIEHLRENGMPVILISHNMQQVFEVADRVQVQRLGKRAAVITPKTHKMSDVVGIMTGAMVVPESEQTLSPVR